MPLCTFYTFAVLIMMVRSVFAPVPSFDTGEMILTPDEYEDTLSAVETFWSHPTYLAHPPDVTVTSNENSNVSIIGNGVEEMRPLVYKWIMEYAAYREPYIAVDTNGSVYLGNLQLAQIPNASEALTGQYSNGTPVNNDFAKRFTGERNSFLDYLISPQIFGDNDMLLHLPLMASGVFVAYYLPQINSSTPLCLTKEQLEGILNGTITYWTDQRLCSPENEFWCANETLLNGDSPIQIFVPGYASVANLVLSSYLLGENSSFGYGWKNAFPQSNIIESRSTVETMGSCLQVQYSLCIGQYSDVLSTVVTTVSLRNSAGYYVGLSSHSIESVTTGHFSSVNISSYQKVNYSMYIDQNGNDSYPLVYMYYMLIRRGSKFMDKPTDCDQAVNLLRFIRFFYSSEEARSSAARLGAVFVPGTAYAAVRNQMKRIRCGNTNNIVWMLLKDQIQNDLASQVDTLTEALLSLLSIPSLILVAYSIWRFARFVSILQRVRDGVYKVPSAAIFLVSRQHTLTDRFKGVVASRRVVDYYTPKSYVHTMYFGRWKAYQVMLRPCSMNIHRLSQAVKRKLVEIMELSGHQRIATFYGLTEVKNGRYFVSNFCPYGDLRSIIIAKEYTFSLNMKYSLAGDIADGMEFLHYNGILHGNLRSCAIYIEANFSAKVGDWEYNTLHRLQGTYFPQEIRLAQTLTLFEQTAFYPWLYWTAPEVLQCGMLGTAVVLTKAQDVYSFGIILGEIFGEEAAFQRYQDGPYNFTPTEIITKILSGNLRPRLSTGNEVPTSMTRLMNFCWAFAPRDRPHFRSITRVLRLVVSPRKPISDLVVIESQLLADKLKKKAKRMEHRYEMVSKSFHKYSRTLVPFPIWRRIYLGHMRPPLNRYEDAVVLRCSLANYDAIIATSDPQIAMDTINLLQRVFEELVEKNGRIYRMYQDGAAVVAVGGAPFGLELDPVHSIAQTALDYLVWANNSRAPSQPALKIRMGIHSGSVAAGCVDYAAAHYVLFGELMKIAFNIERTSEPYRVLISEDFNDKLRQLAKVYVKYKVVESSRTVRGYDKKTFWLIGSNVYDQQYLLDDILYGKDELDIDSDEHIAYGSELGIITDCHGVAVCKPDSHHYAHRGEPAVLDSAAVIRGLKKRKAAAMKMPPPHVLKAQILDHPSQKKHRKKAKHDPLEVESVKVQPVSRIPFSTYDEVEQVTATERGVSPADVLVGIHHAQIQGEHDPGHDLTRFTEFSATTNQAYLIPCDGESAIETRTSDLVPCPSLFQESAVYSEGEVRWPMRIDVLHSPPYGSLFGAINMNSAANQLENIPDRPYTVKSEQPVERATNIKARTDDQQLVVEKIRNDGLLEIRPEKMEDYSRDLAEGTAADPKQDTEHVLLASSSSRAISVYADLPSIHSDIATYGLIPPVRVGISHHESTSWSSAQQDQENADAAFTTSDDALPLHIEQSEIKADEEPLQMLLSVNAPFQPDEDLIGFSSAQTNRNNPLLSLNESSGHQVENSQSHSDATGKQDHAEN
ncbi:uncharacterized protein LOC129586934 isoform X2 [Paramacrobiotus metropolitanus]|uniref:uncharacterized protein LOC129586934 isoform X2 n=1 Tax=Paramacrobiotus metropolitanus TaxID=2943436 RepID=UPI0024460D74|nr:uncharacterized protein LOC129586934 isoform X2 [Paramacrobiotus metropolitanus]